MHAFDFGSHSVCPDSALVGVVFVVVVAVVLSIVEWKPLFGWFVVSFVEPSVDLSVELRLSLSLDSSDL